MSWQSLADVFDYIDTHDDLTSNAVLVLHAIADHTDQHGKGVPLKLSKIERRTKLKKRAIEYALRLLEGCPVTTKGRTIQRPEPVIKTHPHPGRHGFQTYDLLLPHVCIKKGASDASLAENKGASDAPYPPPKGASDAQKGASDAPPRSGFKIWEEEKPCAHAPEEGEKGGEAAEAELGGVSVTPSSPQSETTPGVKLTNNLDLALEPEEMKQDSAADAQEEMQTPEPANLCFHPKEVRFVFKDIGGFCLQCKKDFPASTIFDDSVDVAEEDQAHAVTGVCMERELQRLLGGYPD